MKGNKVGKELQRDRANDERVLHKSNSLLSLKDSSVIIQEIEFSFLSQVGHELRQPLETIMLVKDIIYNSSENCKTKMLLKKLDHSTSHISQMFDTFKDIDNIQISENEGTERFYVNETFISLKNKLTNIITDFKVDCRFLPSRLMINSNKILLEEALYHILKHLILRTNKKRIVVGCRNNSDSFKLEIWYSETKSRLKTVSKISSNKELLFNTTDSTSEKGYINAFVARNILNRLGYIIEEIKEDNYTSLIRISQKENKTEAVNNSSLGNTKKNLLEEKKDKFDIDYPLKKNGHICIISDCKNLENELLNRLENFGYEVTLTNSENSFYALNNKKNISYLVIDDFYDEIRCSKFITQLRLNGYETPIIVVSQDKTIKTAVTALQNGARDFLEAPLKADKLAESIGKISNHDKYHNGYSNGHCHNNSTLETLTPRERQILELVINGNPSKIIASDLGVSQRTIENHRASIMRKTGTRSIASLVRLVVSGVVN
jgi:FixJ family two-component response regulator